MVIKSSMQLLLVGSGGLIGSVLRYLMARGWNEFYGVTRFPWPTLASNLLGSLVLGMVLSWIHTRSAPSALASALLLFGGIGFCGGLTTFSTWIYELQLLAREASPLWLVLYFCGSVAGGGLFFWLGGKII